MANTFWYEIDVPGAGRVREEIKADRHEQAEAIFKSRWGFNPAQPSDGVKLGYHMGGHGEIIENDTIDDNTTNSSSQSNTHSSSSYSGGSMELPSLKSLLVGGVVLYGLSLFGGNVEQLKEIAPNTQQMEYTQQNNTPTSNPFDNVTQYSNHHIDESIPEFFNTDLQEEAIDDLGQTWDN